MEESIREPRCYRLVPGGSGVFFDKAGLKAAVDDVTTAEATHGPISGWDVSRIDDMSWLFSRKSTFNDDIGSSGGDPTELGV